MTMTIQLSTLFRRIARVFLQLHNKEKKKNMKMNRTLKGMMKRIQ